MHYYMRYVTWLLLLLKKQMFLLAESSLKRK